MITRSNVVTAGIAAAAALVATGITYASAATTEAPKATNVVQQAAAPASALKGGDGGSDNYGKDRDYKDRDDKDHDDKGWIHINERSYSSYPGGCITVVSGLGSTSLNIRNDSHKTVEVFRGVTCDNGAPIATVGPKSSSDGVYPRDVRGGVWVKNGVVGSFRVVDDHRHGGGDYDSK
ncbi:hypothetical protein [Streptomyces sp. SYSU K217416]